MVVSIWKRCAGILERRGRHSLQKTLTKENKKSISGFLNFHTLLLRFYRFMKCSNSVSAFFSLLKHYCFYLYFLQRKKMASFITVRAELKFISLFFKGHCYKDLQDIYYKSKKEFKKWVYHLCLVKWTQFWLRRCTT